LIGLPLRIQLPFRYQSKKVKMSNELKNITTFRNSYICGSCKVNLKIQN
jgi:hypothetical protein